MRLETSSASTLPDGTEISYIVDGANRRIGRRVNGVLTQAFVYQGALRPVAELDASGGVVTRFVYGIGINVPDYFTRGGVTYRIMIDYLGSPRLVIDAATGAIVQQMEYDPFGRVVLDTNPGFQPFGFAGGLYDPLTGLVRFGARDYDPETGRWTSKDPAGFESDANFYAYGGNDPVDHIDRRGDDWQSAGKSFVGGIVGGAAATIAVTAGIASGTAVGAAVAITAVGVGTYSATIALQS